MNKYKKGFIEGYSQRLQEKNIYKRKIYKQAIHIPKLKSSGLKISRSPGFKLQQLSLA